MRRFAFFACIASSACTLLVDTGDLTGGSTPKPEAGMRPLLYFDGAVVQTGGMDARPLMALPADPFIGAASETDCSWKGRIAEVAFYEKALGDERIAAHWAARLK